MCSQCERYLLDIQQFIDGYDGGYSFQAIEELQQMRKELCTLKAECGCEKCIAEELIKIIDTNPDIQKKKGK